MASGIFTSSPFGRGHDHKPWSFLVKVEAVESLFGAALAFGHGLPLKGGHSSLELDP